MNSRVLPFSLAVGALLFLGWCTGCSAPPIKPVLTDSDPSVKIPAMEQAVAHHDISAVPVLIKSLESDDPAVRFYADNALRKLTGRDFGYLYYAEESLRRPAVEKWKAWYADSTGVTVQAVAASAADTVSKSATTAAVTTGTTQH